MSEIFNDKTTAEIDAKLHRDILKHNLNIEKFSIGLVILLMILFRGWIFYWLKFGVAVPTNLSNKSISILQEPIMEAYSPSVQRGKSFKYNSLIKNDSSAQLIPQAHYEISGRVIFRNNDIYVGKYFDSVAAYNLGLTWGKTISEPKFFKKHLDVYGEKDHFSGMRNMYWRWYSLIPLQSDYINSHISYIHVIPANKNILAALLKLKNFNKVKIEGELVDVNFKNSEGSQPISYYTSLSTKDAGTTGRGSGSSEIMYVTTVQIGKFIYK